MDHHQAFYRVSLALYICAVWGLSDTLWAHSFVGMILDLSNPYQGGFVKFKKQITIADRGKFF
jgi:hypothetical protein